jgi:uncharacterized membrane protein
MESSTRRIAFAGLIAAAYVVFTVTPPLNAVAYGGVQVRVSEALNVLALLNPLAIPALWLGAGIANLFGPFGVIDMTLGAGTTLVAATVVWLARRRPVAALAAPVVLNALAIPIVILAAGAPEAYWLLALQIAAGQFVAVYLLGLPLLALLRASGLADRLPGTAGGATSGTRQ